MNDIINPNSLFNSINQQKLPPVDSWNPPYCGEIDICIHADGQWSYNGSIITRDRLVKLFSRVLKREGTNYFLVTPVEKVKITVEAEPFITVALEQKKSRPTTLAFKTNLDQVVIADKNHPITVVDDENGLPYPTLGIRSNLCALISRSDFYQLVDLATTEFTDSSNHEKHSCFVESNGCKFSLGVF